MSRIGKKPIPLPQGVKFEVKGNTVVVQGPKGKRLGPQARMELEGEGEESESRMSSGRRAKRVEGVKEPAQLSHVRIG